MTDRIANRDASAYVQNRMPFVGSHTYGNTDLHDTYVVYSYGPHFPLFVYTHGQWFETTDKFSRTTSKHQSQLRPQCPTIPTARADLREIIANGLPHAVANKLNGADYLGETT